MLPVVEACIALSLIASHPRLIEERPPKAIVEHAIPKAKGWASYYATGPGPLDAAAGPGLRHGNWRGTVVTVTANGHSVTVRLTDWCACRPRHGLPTLIDLSPSAFRRLSPLSAGIVRVTVTP